MGLVNEYWCHVRSMYCTIFGPLDSHCILVMMFISSIEYQKIQGFIDVFQHNYDIMIIFMHNENYIWITKSEKIGWHRSYVA